jgi:HK97 family phage major capsid protein
MRNGSFRTARRDGGQARSPEPGATRDRFELKEGQPMAFDSIISRADASALIPDEVVQDVVKAAAQQSAALSLFKTVNLGTKFASMPVMSALAQAYFVNGDTGLKQTTEMAWDGVQLVVEEIAAFVPVPEAVVDDTDFDLWGEVQTGLAEAVGLALDAAVFSAVNKPASWPAAIIPAAIAAGNVATQGTATVEEGGIVGDIDTALDAVEGDGFDASGSRPSAPCGAFCAAPGTARASASRT